MKCSRRHSFVKAVKGTFASVGKVVPDRNDSVDYRFSAGAQLKKFVPVFVSKPLTRSFFNCPKARE